MGVNMPARTCIFTALRKWDGEENRVLLSGEYIQMSGRAGRRGKDDRGLCIMMVDDRLTQEACRCVARFATHIKLAALRMMMFWPLLPHKIACFTPCLQ